ncbi:MAG: biotin carboxylase N-terminal domain-containing protein [Desulfobacterales bacterium]
MKQLNTILVANRGEIACRILRTINKMGLSGVLAYHEMDADSPAVRMASTAVRIEGPSPVAAYLNIDQIVDACKKTRADAVHPGFGFLAENPSFAQRVAREGIRFIGPLPETIRLMGNKLLARSFCIEHEFPLAPSAAENESADDFFHLAHEIGFPLLIKSAAGGGGKGMHIASGPDELRKAMHLAKSEGIRFFGDDTLYAERYIDNPRHIEVQILADHFGNVVHLGERECSIQRRFQKIVEESPSPCLSSDLRQRICETAVSIARQSGYRNAGTVEFLLAPDGRFYFLEMNTRIQVEHPVTEMVTGMDLVELQIRICRGEKLPFDQGEIKSMGHAIEMRLYAEDPENDFLPAVGRLLTYEMPKGEGIRVDNGYIRGMKVTSAFDPMLAKLIVHGPNREQALNRAREALNQTLVLGVTTNIDFLKQLLSHSEFCEGRIDTGFIHRNADHLQPPSLSEKQRHLILAAIALSHRDFIDPDLAAPFPYNGIGDWRN